MVDLFGKKKLEDRVMELEAALTELERSRTDLAHTLEKRDEKIRRLTSAYQECNLALKSAQKKAPLDREDGPGEASGVREERAALRADRIAPREMEAIMTRLKECRCAEDDLLSAYLADARGLPLELESAAQAIKSERGVVALRYPQLFTWLIVPPFPVQESISNLGDVFLLDPLSRMMEIPVLVISAHAGDTFLGIAYSHKGFEVQEFVESPVKEKHSKGGWSQKRFERLREEDIRHHIDEVLQRLLDLSARYDSVVSYAVLAGDASLIREITPAIHRPVIGRRLGRHDAARLDRLLDEIYGFALYRF